jgi:outer membrane protein TolC
LGVSEFPYGSVSKTNNGMMPRKMLMLRLKQMFPNFNKQKKEQEYYQSFANQNEDDRATMQNMLFAKAKMAYYDAFIAEKKLTILHEQQKQLQLLIQIAEGRLAYGKARLPNIYKARAKLSDLQSMQVKLQSKTKQAVAILNSLMNRPLNAPLSIDTSIDLQQVNILQIDSTYIRTNRSDIAHTSDAIHTMKLKQKMAAQMAKPTFGITWDNMRMPAFENNGMYMFSAMAMISIPIAPWFSKGYKSKINAMDYQIQAMKKMREHQVLKALGNIQKDWLNLQSAKHELQIFKNEVIPAYAKTYQANLNAFSENTGDIYETLMAWNDLTMKKMEYYDKLGDLLNIRVMLETEIQTSSP